MGEKGSRIGQKEELQNSCTRASASPTEPCSWADSSELKHHEARGLGLYIPAVTSHGVWEPLRERG